MDHDEPNVLDTLPLEVLLALHEAAVDPTEEGRERARQRAAEAGFHLACTGAPGQEPIPMEEAPEGVEGLLLRFDR